MLDKLNDIVIYLRTRQQRRLYKQWVRMAGLPSEAVPQTQAMAEIQSQTYRRRTTPTVLYVLLGITLLIFGAIFILLAMQSC